MNVDHILETLAGHQVAYILIGGMNFLLRHSPVLTYDIDFWIEDTPENRGRCERALGELGAQWGAADADWGPVAERRPGWLDRQSLFCLMSPYGPIDVFRAVPGLETWGPCRARAQQGATPAGTPFVGLCDGDMLACQVALPESQRKLDRIAFLKRAMGAAGHA